MAQEVSGASKTRRSTVVTIPESVGDTSRNVRSSPRGAERQDGTGSAGRAGQRRNTDTSATLGRADQHYATETGSGQSTMRRVTHSRISATVDPPLAATNPSLTIYREQYCCLSRRTKLERLLFGLVTLLAVVILLLFLIVMLVILPQNDDDDEARSAPLISGTLFWTSTGDRL